MPEAVIPKLNNKRVRKWGRMLLAIADDTTAIPSEFFGEDHLPIALPAGYKDMGFISTDGITETDSLTSEGTTMLQSLEEVRNDLTGRVQTLALAFGESNAWTNALAHGRPVSEWAEDRDAPWIFDDGELSDWPYYRLFLIGQDGVGPSAIYKVEFAYSAKITAKTDRVKNRSTPETIGFTFGLYKDPVVDKSFTRAENGPSMNPPVTP